MDDEDISSDDNSFEIKNTQREFKVISKTDGISKNNAPMNLELKERNKNLTVFQQIDDKVQGQDEDSDQTDSKPNDMVGYEW